MQNGWQLILLFLLPLLIKHDIFLLVKKFRDESSALANVELERALMQLKNGKSPELLLQRLAHNITQKMLHKPTTELRKAALSGELELFLAIKKIFE